MQEKLLQFIWQFQYFNKANIISVEGNVLYVHHPGTLNKNQGPDFSGARITIDDKEWAGSVEIHINSSNWTQHNHSADSNYNQVILHVVWQHDQPVESLIKHGIPTLEIQPLVPNLLLHKYSRLLNACSFVPCEKFLPALSEIEWTGWKERLAIERLQIKVNTVLFKLESAKAHWEEVFWWLLASSFGGKVNSGLFEEVAKSIPLSVLSRHKNQVHQLEAMLIGQAGLLNDSFTDKYPLMLQSEYKFLAKKYSIQQLKTTAQFLRMRPVAFPTIRLAQLAMLINQSSHLFSRIIQAAEVIEVIKMFNVTANDYWHYHYHFNDVTSYLPKQTGKAFINMILINTVIPVLHAYGVYKNDIIIKTRAVDWMNSLPPEQNNITRDWKSFGIKNKTALDSQSLLHLKNDYCAHLRCLDCAVGCKILRNGI